MDAVIGAIEPCAVIRSLMPGYWKTFQIHASPRVNMRPVSVTRWAPMRTPIIPSNRPGGDLPRVRWPLLARNLQRGVGGTTY